MKIFGNKKDKKEESGADGQIDSTAAGGDDDGEGKGKGKTEEEKSVGEMKRGDYMIHIYIEKAKDLKCPEDATVDPLVQIDCMTQKGYTSSKKDIGSIGEVIWLEHIFLEQSNVEKKEAEDGKISIKLMDKGFFKNSLIGQFEFDLSYIYFMKDHLLLHRWIALSNPNAENYAEITGYLKLSISIAASGDEQIQITDDDDEADEDVIMPPQLNPKFYQMKFRFFQVQELPAMDMSIKFVRKAKTDAYVMTKYKNKKLKTKVVVHEKGGPPTDWNQEIWVPAQIPILSPTVVFHLMDRDDVFDEMVGSLQFKISDVLECKNDDKGKYFWMNIYGSPMNQSDSAEKKHMNNCPDDASNWKGRILINIECEETEKPVAKVTHIEPEMVKEAELYMGMKNYSIIAEIGQGIVLPKKKKYKVKLIVGGKEFETKEAMYQKNNYNRFNERFEQKTFQFPYNTIDNMDKIIIQLMDGDSPICYYKDDIANYKTKYNEDTMTWTHDGKYKWVSLLPDPCVKKVKDPNEAGMLSFRLAIHDVSRNDQIDFKGTPWKNKPGKRGNPVTIRAYIYQCRDLPAADSNGTSDPYVKVWDMSDEQKKTEVIEDNTNPLYYTAVQLEYEIRGDDMNDLDNFPPFIFDVFDEDQELMDSSDDYLARAIIQPKQCAITIQGTDFDNKNAKNEIPAVPQWHPLRFTEQDEKSGEILVSFAVSDCDYNYQMKQPERVDLSSRVDFREFDCNMLILGLRALQSPGILPIKKAFIQFNIKSLVPANSSALQNIKTQPSAPGPNPTINTTIKFSIPLPVDQLYCPKLMCTAYDYIFKGFNQPMIGVFSIPIGELMMALKAERKEETEIMEVLNEKLEDIIKAGDLEPNSYGKKKGGYRTSINDIDNLSDTQIEREDDEESVVSDRPTQPLIQKSKMAGKVKSGGSSNTNKQKRELEKRMAGSELYKDGKEGLGAGEYEGHNTALSKKEQQLDMVGKMKKGLLLDDQQEADTQFQQFNMAMSPSQRKAASKMKASTSALSDKASLLKGRKEAQDLEKRIEDDERKRALEELDGEEGASVVLMPKYIMDKRLKVEREAHPPPPDSVFIPLGWDEDSTTKRKHYRQYYNDELENIKEVFPKKSPFTSFDIIRGQSRGLAKGGFLSFFSSKKKQDAQGQVSTLKTVGYFKGIVEIESKEEREAYKVKKTALINELIEHLNEISKKMTGEKMDIDTQALESAMERRKLDKQLRELNVDHLNITTHLCNLESDEILKRGLLSSVKCIVRVYFISAFDLSSRDNGSPSDPYLYLVCNKKTVNDRDNYQLDEANPKFYKHYNFEGTFPGCSPLQVDVWDYDDIFGDDLIGTSMVDLEDRYFSMEWQSLEYKPIEYRQIYHQCSSISQGVVKMWVEINPISIPSDEITTWDISEKPPEEFEVRVCVFNCEDVKLMDIEGTVDCYCKTFFDSKEDVQETDTHYRNQDGKPDFQYRLIYRIQVPRKDYKLTVQAWDRDFFVSNDMIGEASINIKNLVLDCQLVKKPLQLNKTYYNDVLAKSNFQKLKFDSSNPSRFWLEMRQKNRESGKEEVNGKVKVQIDVLPVALAEKNPVGKARKDPNHSPTLPEPEGRIEWSLNPFKMWEQMLGPEMRRKIYKWLCCLTCLVLCIGILPTIFANMATDTVAAPFLWIWNGIKGIFSGSGGASGG